VITPATQEAIGALPGFDDRRRRLLTERIERRRNRAANQQRIDFLPADATISGTAIKVQDARDGNFVGAEIPQDLQRQWIQGTGPGARPGAAVEKSLRNVAYALLSGADGWVRLIPCRWIISET